ncbi:MAG: Gfo/Idh/MocA family oxidoreductase, partial [Methanomicrobiales archaeon]|nr:Gfo/Idh/MocA family oxidoreductase [Methanomicrobiales archaeon]
MKVTDPRILVIGAGSIGCRHAGNLHALGCDVGVHDVAAERMKTCCTTTGCWEVPDLGQALGSGDFDAAVICTPTVHHVPVAQMCADAGLHLFIEKPLSDRYEGVDQVLDTLRSRDLMGMVGFNLRYEPGLLWLKQNLDPRTIAFGRVEFGSYLPSWRPEQDYRCGYSARKDLGGGIVLDDVHEIDYPCWIFGYPQTVQSAAGRFGHLEINVEDTAEIHLIYPDQVLTVHMDYLQRNYTRRATFCTRDGYLVTWTFGVGVTWADTSGDHTYSYAADFRINDLYVAEMQDFLTSLAGGRSPQSSLANGAEI